MNKDNRWLITIDLDGTLLSNDSTNGIYEERIEKKANKTTKDVEEHLVSEKNIKEIRKCIEKGHKVAIVTGRPWRDTKEIYKKINLYTVVSNYNGAHIHHPHDKGFLEIKTAMNRKFFRKILNDDIMKKIVKNFIIEFDDVTYMLDTNDEGMRKQFHILKNHSGLKECKMDFEPKKNPHVIIFRLESGFKYKYTLITSLRRKYGEALSFRFWENKKYQTTFLEVNQKFISKSYAMKYIASYYNIPISRTIAFGDGENDIEMLSNAERGVAMKNATDVVKSYAKDVTDFYNNEDGVGRYLEEFFYNK